jgi:predicted ArsR family transcriptional regulator
MTGGDNVKGVDTLRGQVSSAGLPAEPAVAAVAALHDESRRRLYEFIRRQRRPVTREDAADGLGISRKLAAFHLDKLVDVGLLRARVETGADRHKVGRRPKVYEPSGVDLTVAVPDRRPDLLADILVEAVLTDSPEGNARSAALRIAHEHGRRIGAAERDRVRPGRLGLERALSLAESLLQCYGFEPGREGPALIRLRNCPFHPIVERSPALVCAINHAFVTGLLDGLEAGTAQATLARRPGECCVELCSR